MTLPNSPCSHALHIFTALVKRVATGEEFALPRRAVLVNPPRQKGRHYSVVSTHRYAETRLTEKHS
jgi:hypothetical protein